MPTYDNVHEHVVDHGLGELLKRRDLEGAPQGPVQLDQVGRGQPRPQPLRVVHELPRRFDDARAGRQGRQRRHGRQGRRIHIGLQECWRHRHIGRLGLRGWHWLGLGDDLGLLRGLGCGDDLGHWRGLRHDLGHRVGRGDDLGLARGFGDDLGCRCGLQNGLCLGGLQRRLQRGLRDGLCRCGLRSGHSSRLGYWHRQSGSVARRG